MNSCDKCKQESSTVTSLFLIGRFQADLCRACMRSADEYLLGEPRSIRGLEAKLAAAVYQGDVLGAAKFADLVEDERIRLWHVSKAWVQGETTNGST